MKNEIGISVVDAVIHIDCSFFELSSEVVLERLRELMPVLERVLSADQVWHKLPDDLVLPLLDRRLRCDLLYQAAVAQALGASSRLFEVVPTSLSVFGQEGFPTDASEDH
jgi:hypothetical protein